MVWLQLQIGGRKGPCEMSAHVQKTKSEFLKRKMLTGLSGKYNDSVFLNRLFVQIKCGSLAESTLFLWKKNTLIQC